MDRDREMGTRPKDEADSCSLSRPTPPKGRRTSRRGPIGAISGYMKWGIDDHQSRELRKKAKERER